MEPWSRRRAACLAWLRQIDADLLALQEVRDDQQAASVREALPEHAFLGIRRGLAHEAECEMAPLLYRRSCFEEVDHGWFWLSATPHLFGSTFHGACFARLAGWAALRHRASGRMLTLFNTHFDNLTGDECSVQRRSAALIRRRIDALGPDMPVLCCGDLNATRGSATWRILQGEDAARLADAAESVAGGLPGTYHGFDAGFQPEAIDAILSSRHLQVRHACTVRPDGPGFASDHDAVVATVAWR